MGIGALVLESGRWTVVEPSGDMRVLVNDRSKGFREAVVDDGARWFRIDSAGSYDILIVPESDSLRVHGLHLVHE